MSLFHFFPSATLPKTAFCLRANPVPNTCVAATVSASPSDDVSLIHLQDVLDRSPCYRPVLGLEEPRPKSREPDTSSGLWGLLHPVIDSAGQFFLRKAALGTLLVLERSVDCIWACVLAMLLHYGFTRCHRCYWGN